MEIKHSCCFGSIIILSITILVRIASGERKPIIRKSVDFVKVILKNFIKICNKNWIKMSQFLLDLPSRNLIL